MATAAPEFDPNSIDSVLRYLRQPLPPTSDDLAGLTEATERLRIALADYIDAYRTHERGTYAAAYGSLANLVRRLPAPPHPATRVPDLERRGVNIHRELSIPAIAAMPRETEEGAA